MSIIGSVVGGTVSAAINGGVKLATEILRRSNNAEVRKYIDEYVAAEKKLLAERSKPMEDQFDNVVEHYEATLKILFEAAEQEYVKQVASN